MVVASIYFKYKTRVSSKTTDSSMEIVDQITSAGPKVPSPLTELTSQSHHCFLEFEQVL
jgi:hypothetical protein